MQKILIRRYHPSMKKDMSVPRTRNIFDPESKEPFRLSRSKLELFLQCSRCFYLDRKCGVGRPDFPAFTLNNAVDALLKREFDGYRVLQEPHPLMTQAGFNGVPFYHPDLNDWRKNTVGVQTIDKENNFLLYGAVDDLWVDEQGRISVVDYKATSSAYEVSLEGEWKKSYKRQVEMYQWLLKKNKFDVSDTAYFVYANGDASRDSFSKTLSFDIKVLPYKGDSSWVDDALLEAKACLLRESAPKETGNCTYCAYVRMASTTEQYP